MKKRQFKKNQKKKVMLALGIKSNKQWRAYRYKKLARWLSFKNFIKQGAIYLGLKYSDLQIDMGLKMADILEKHDFVDALSFQLKAYQKYPFSFSKYKNLDGVPA